MSKSKYYFRKPRSEIAKDILTGVAISGVICVAVTSPYFLLNLQRNLRYRKKYNKKKLSSAFHRLKRDGYICVKKKNHQIYVSLTEEGKKKAGSLQIDALKIKRPKKWDGNWRVIIFDIAHLKKSYREAFRGKLKELGFCLLQKSVWVHPFDCRDEIEILKEFFGLGDQEVRLITASDIGESKLLKKLFRLN